MESRKAAGASGRAAILYGVKSIAAYLGVSVHVVYARIRRNAFPVFRLGNVVCARRPTLDAYFSKLEESATAGDRRRN